MISLDRYGVRLGRSRHDVNQEPLKSPTLYQIEGLSFSNVRSWVPEFETLDDDRIAIPFITNAAEPNGVTAEQLTAIMIHRLQLFQQGSHACKENADAILHLQRALHAMESRARRMGHPTEPDEPWSPTPDVIEYDDEEPIGRRFAWKHDKVPPIT